MKISMSIMWAAVVLFVLSLSACSSSKYGDLENVMNDQANAMETYISSMEKAENAQDVTAAIGQFTSDMSALIPSLKKIAEKYPEITDMKEPPEALKKTTKKMEELSGRMQVAMMKAMQYMQDSGVQKAMENQARIMMEKSKQ